MTVDELAQEIRRVDGNHSLGAAALAEALMPFLAALDAERVVRERDEARALKVIEELKQNARIAIDAGEVLIGVLLDEKQALRARLETVEAETRERCAKVADYGVQRAHRDWHDRKKAEGAHDMAEEIAAAIRALSQEGSEPS